MTDRELFEKALEALEEAHYKVQHRQNHDGREEVITALRERLAHYNDPSCAGAFMRAEPEHITDGSPCWCNPETDYVDPETGAAVIVHKRPQ